MIGSRGGSAPQRFDKALNKTNLLAKIRPDLRTPEASINNPILSTIVADFSLAQGPPLLPQSNVLRMVFNEAKFIEGAQPAQPCATSKSRRRLDTAGKWNIVVAYELIGTAQPLQPSLKIVEIAFR